MAWQKEIEMGFLYKIKRWLGLSCSHDYRQLGFRADKFYACYSVFKCSKCENLIYRIQNEQ